MVTDTGIRSRLSFQLFTSGDSLGALNLYSPHPHGFDADDRAEGTGDPRAAPALADAPVAPLPGIKAACRPEPSWLTAWDRDWTIPLLAAEVENLAAQLHTRGLQASRAAAATVHPS